MWDATSLKLLKSLEGHEDNVRVLTVDEHHLYSGSWDKTIRVWDLATFHCKKVLTGHSEAVLALASARGFLASGSYDTTVRFWNLETFRCAHKCEGHVDAVRVLTSLGPDAEMVFSGSYDGSIGFFHLPSPEAGDTWPQVTSQPRSMRSRPQGALC